MKTVVQFIHELGDGGGSSIVKDYGLCLKKDGYNVVVLVVFPELSSVNYQLLKQNGVEIRCVFNNKSFLHRLENKLFAKYFISRKIKQLVKEVKPIALHCHLQVLTYLTPCSKDLKDVNLFYTCHSLPDQFFTGRYASEFNAAISLIKKNDLQMIALHEPMAAKMNKMFGISNTIVVSNGIDLQRFLECKADRNQVRRDNGIPKDAFVVGHIGRFNKVKNHRHLINVFKAVREKKTKSFLLMIGTGELQSEIEERINNEGLSSCTKILSHRTDIPELMRAMDAFVFPSFYEGLSVVLIEAQAVRLKCVISSTIPDESILSNIVTKVSLNAPISEWRDAVLTESTEEYMADFSSCDIAKNIKEVEKLYER